MRPTRKKSCPQRELSHILFCSKSEGEEDFNSIKYGAGISASHKTMSSKEKEIEFKRWQTSIWARIPDQPTFEELGMDKCVFFLEERRK
jgi:hypothetical protein